MDVAPSSVHELQKATRFGSQDMEDGQDASSSSREEEAVDKVAKMGSTRLGDAKGLMRSR